VTRQPWEVPVAEYGATRASVGQWRIGCIGNSTTKRGLAFPTWHNWPEFDLRNRLGAYANVINLGQAGSTISDHITNFVAWSRTRAPFDYVLLLIGLNTVRTQITPDAVAAEAELTSLYTLCDQVSTKLIGVTIAPWTDGTWTLTREGVRQAINTWILAGGGGMLSRSVNIETAVADNSDPNHPVIKPELAADGLHFNDAGGLVVAEQVFTQAFGGVPLPRK